MTVPIRRLEAADIESMAAGFLPLDPHKTPRLYARYLRDQEAGERLVLVAADLSGYLTVDFRSGNPPFRQAGVPEITDLNVLPAASRSSRVRPYGATTT